MPTTDPTRRRRVRFPHVAAALVALAVLAGPIVAFADFSDVPPSHPFATEIGWMEDTGISTGFPDGTYRPGEPVTRQAMSAFMVRLFNVQAGLSGQDYEAASISPTGTSWTEVAGTTVTVPPGTTARLFIDFSARSQCTGGAQSGGPLPIYPTCSVRVLVDGFELQTAGGTYFDSSLSGDHTAGDWDSNALVRFTEPLGPGEHTVTVQGQPYVCIFSCSGYVPPAMTLGQRTLTVQGVLSDVAL